jgi:hypothetical protein
MSEMADLSTVKRELVNPREHNFTSYARLTLS